MDTVDPSSPELVWAQAVEILKDRIRAGVYPGRLPAEGELAESLGCSRGSTRHALSVLADEGWVRIVPNKGVYPVRQF